jgi:hypothetical protein
VYGNEVHDLAVTHIAGTTYGLHGIAVPNHVLQLCPTSLVHIPHYVLQLCHTAPVHIPHYVFQLCHTAPVHIPHYVLQLCHTAPVHIPHYVLQLCYSGTGGVCGANRERGGWTGRRRAFPSQH